MVKRGFTLAELLITIVILAVLTAIALPQFQKTGDKANKDQAIADLRRIQTAEKIYFLKNGVYIYCDNKSDFQNILGVELSPVKYYYVVDEISATSFNAYACNNASGYQIRINQKGEFAEGYGLYIL